MSFGRQRAREFVQDIAHYPVPAPCNSLVPQLAPVPENCPLSAVSVAVKGPGGTIWVGGRDGAARLRDGAWRCFWGKRWLPDNRVRDIACDTAATYLNTEVGWARIEERSITLETKAEHYQRITEERHTNNGFVARCLLRPGSEPSHFYRSVDNDGLWTGLYVAAQCFRFAACGDQRARERAEESMRALLRLEQVTGIPGFPARSMVFRDASNVIWTEGEWMESWTIPGCWWKGDTSSDELSGHFFAHHVFAEHMPESPLKRQAAQTCGRILDHLLEHDFRLVGADGRPTRWANFNPDSLNHDPAWDHEKNLNSLCMLAFLVVGHRVTGRREYLDVFRYLADAHGYVENAVYQKMLPPFEVNHSDDQLAFLAFYSLLHLLPEGPDRERLEEGLRISIDIERPERCSLFNLIAASVVPDDGLVADALATLQEWPWDLRDWECRNDYRTDVCYSIERDRFGRPQLCRVLSPAERPVYRWNTNPYVADGGGDGSIEEDGAAWLLAFWLGRYHGLL